MTIHFRKRIKRLLVLASLTILAACGTFQVDIEPGTTVVSEESIEATLTILVPTQTLEATPLPADSPEQPEPPPTQTPVATEEADLQPLPEQPDPSPLWVAYRDEEHGYGLALPCYWVIDSAHGLRISSYDFVFALTHSTRSYWTDGEIPNGAFSPDIGVIEYSDRGLAPGTLIQEAVPQFIDDEVATMEEVTLGANTALLVHFKGKNSPEEWANRIYFFQLSPEKLLMFAPKWQNAVESPDVQAILASISLSTEESVQLPSAPPEDLVEGREVYMSQETGTCFQYPSDFTLEEFTPSQPLTMGPLVTLKLDRPLYSVDLTLEVEKIGTGLSLDEAVTRFMDQFTGESSLSINRNPMELVGGAFYHLGGEPAELLDEVPGTEASRDLFAKHEDRLYHLIVRPSFQSDPQAADEMSALYEVVRATFTYIPLGE